MPPMTTPRQLLRTVALGLACLSQATFAEPTVPVDSQTSAQPQTVKALQKAAWTAMEAKDYSLAIQLWNQLLAQKPNDLNALAGRSSLYSATGQHDKAQADFIRVSEIEPKSGDTWRSLCETFVYNNSPAIARPACERAVEVDATKLDMAIHLGHAWLLQGDVEMAKTLYTKALLQADIKQIKTAREEKGLFDSFIEKGWQVEAVRQIKVWFAVKVQEQLSRIVQAEIDAAPQTPVNLEALRESALDAEDASDWEKAIELWSQIIARAPNDSQALRLRGGCFSKIREYDLAENDFKRAVELAPNDEKAWVSLCWGQLTVGQGDPATARPACEKAQALAPLDPIVNVALGHIFFITQDMATAQSWYDKAAPLFAKESNPEASTQLQTRHGGRSRAELEIIKLLYDQYVAKKEYALALPGMRWALAQTERVYGRDHSKVAYRLNHLAVLLETMGSHAEAEPLYRRIIDIEVNNFDGEVTKSIANLALLLKNRGRYEEAVNWQKRSLAIIENSSGLESGDAVIARNDYADTLFETGRYAETESILRYNLHLVENNQRIFSIFQLVDGNVEAGINVQLGRVLYKTGRFMEAERQFRRGIALWETDEINLPTVFDALATLLMDMGRHTEAEPLLRQALNLTEKNYGTVHAYTSPKLLNLGSLLALTGRFAEAETIVLRALSIEKAIYGIDTPRFAYVLNSLGDLLIGSDRYVEAQPILQKAYRIALNSGNPDLLQRTQTTLSRLLQAQNNPEAAIFFGKQAVNTLQGLRANVAGLGKDTLKSFDTSIEGTYRRLSSLLIAEGRLVEAERVLELLKEQEQFQFVRRDASVSALTGKASLTAFEAAQETALQTAGAPLAKQYAELSRLEDQKVRSADEEARLLALRTELEQAGQAFQKVLDSVIAALNTTRHDKAEDIKEAQGLQNTLRELGDQIDDKVVALYTVVDAEGYSLILTTPDYRRAYSVPLKAAELNAQIAAFRDSLKNPKQDPRPQAKALLDIILPPAARTELAQAKAGTLMWHLDGSLRLLPLAALHDGEQYLVERYRLTTFTSASTANLKDAPKARWNGLGLGVSEARTVADKQFSALTAVPAELNTVIRENDSKGVIPGQRHLNQDFNWDALQAQLKRKGQYPLVHIASHFNLEPGNDTMSYLLPGAGEPITLAQLTRQNNLFGGVDLLTLSACETGVGGGKGADGREVDGLSFIAQRQGAKAVVATLWPVADASTAQLMERFYSLRESRKLTKAEALRQAQLALLRGETPLDTKTDDQRGAKRADVGSAQAAYVTDPKAPYAHPYYWAPFILMGNWL